jgi:hypothetical protein
MLFVTAATGKSAAVNIYNYREFALNLFGCENVKEKAVFTISISFTLAEFVVIENLFGHILLVIEGSGLICASTVFGCLIYAIPMSYLFWILKATCGSVSYALVRYNALYPAFNASKGAAGSIDNIFHIFYPL